MSASNLQIVAGALAAAYSLFDGINRQHGKGDISAVTVSVNGTDLDNGIVKGYVTRNYGGGCSGKPQSDQRTFSLKANSKGKVAVRFLDKRQTVSAN